MNKSEIVRFWLQNTHQLTRMKHGIFKGRGRLAKLSGGPSDEIFHVGLKS